MSWCEQALEKLNQEYKAGNYDRYGSVMKKSVADALKSFCAQDEEFAQAIAQGGSFENCMKAVCQKCGSGISDLEAYKRAVKFYFAGADVEFQMRVILPGGAAEEEKPTGIMLSFLEFL